MEWGEIQIPNQLINGNHGRCVKSPIVKHLIGRYASTHIIKSALV